MMIGLFQFMQKTFLCCLFCWGLWPHVLTGQETALPFRAGTFTPEQMATTVQVDIRGTWAMVLQPESEGLVPTFYRYEDSSWMEADTPSLGFHAGIRVAGLDFNEVENEVAVFGEDRIFFFQPNVFTAEPNDWVVSKPSLSILLDPGTEVVNVELEGDTAAVVWKTDSLNPFHYLTIYEQGSSTIWEEKATWSIDGPGLFGIEPQIITGLSLLEDRVAIASSRVGEIHLFERDEGGADHWGLVKKIERSPDYPIRGDEIALMLGDYLLDVGYAGDGEQITTEINRYQRDQGGPNKWLKHSLVASYPGVRELELDASFSSLLVLSRKAAHPSSSSIIEATLSASEARDVLLESLTFLTGGAVGKMGEATFTGVVGDLENSTSNSILGLMVGMAPDSYEGSGRWAVSVLSAFDFSLRQTLSDEGSTPDFSSMIDMEGGFIAVGNPSDSWAGVNSGSVLLYEVVIGYGDEGQTLRPIARLESPDPASYQYFGHSVSLQVGTGNLLAVGVPNWSGGVGRVYLYRIFSTLSSTDGERAELVDIIESPTGTGDYFGRGVALTANSLGEPRLAVGAPFDDEVGTSAGAVYIFEENSGTWTQRKKIPRPSIMSSRWFGWLMTFLSPEEGGELVVATDFGTTGAQLGVFSQNESGPNAWGLEGSIATPAGASTRFGISLAGGGNAFAVGAPFGSGNVGKVFLYRQLPIGWVLSREVVGTAADGRSFGYQVSLSDFHLAVGSPEVNSLDGRLSVYGGGYQDYVNWPSLYSRQGTASESLGRGLASQGIYTASTGAGDLCVERAGAYEIWAKAQGWSTSDAWQPQQNSDGDSQNNLVEFSLGSDPRDESSTGGIDLKPDTFTETDIFGGPGETYPTMSWLQPNLGYSDLFVGYTAQTSSNLVDWDFQSIRYFYLGESVTQHYRIDPEAERAFFRAQPYYPSEIHANFN
ncbi:hypothetical protein GCM10007100_03440 [Roseibacillus persicicus]|uniref:Uncharacterized protein n=2 Tax=Roseibacillus persicicus TaxID=454148 RepID=A0A918TE15_9BACT|nr:hypothetical protein GCM10007100_03440 [Roseibacillus persicicus]